MIDWSKFWEAYFTLLGGLWWRAWTDYKVTIWDEVKGDLMWELAWARSAGVTNLIYTEYVDRQTARFVPEHIQQDFSNYPKWRREQMYRDLTKRSCLDG